VAMKQLKVNAMLIVDLNGNYVLSERAERCRPANC